MQKNTAAIAVGFAEIQQQLRGKPAKVFSVSLLKGVHL